MVLKGGVKVRRIHAVSLMVGERCKKMTEKYKRNDSSYPTSFSEGLPQQTRRILNVGLGYFSVTCPQNSACSPNGPGMFIKLYYFL